MEVDGRWLIGPKGRLFRVSPKRKDGLEGALGDTARSITAPSACSAGRSARYSCPDRVTSEFFGEAIAWGARQLAHPARIPAHPSRQSLHSPQALAD